MASHHRALDAARDELRNLDPRLGLAMVVCRLLPDLVGIRLRAVVLRFAGVSIGPGSVIGGAVTISGAERPALRVKLGRNAWLNAGCHFDATERIELGDEVGLGQEVMVLTLTHHMGPAWRRLGNGRPAPVRIGDGCWVGARALILPGVTIGRGSVVAAGAVVTADVPPNSIVGGVPAKVIRPLDEGGPGASGA